MTDFTSLQPAAAVLLDSNADLRMAERMRAAMEADGDRLTYLHLWRLGPGDLSAILSVATQQERRPGYYQSVLSQISRLVPRDCAGATAMQLQRQ
jgi:hypothetical protein